MSPIPDLEPQVPQNPHRSWVVVPGNTVGWRVETGDERSAGKLPRNQHSKALRDNTAIEKLHIECIITPSELQQYIIVPTIHDIILLRLASYIDFYLCICHCSWSPIVSVGLCTWYQDLHWWNRLGTKSAYIFCSRTVINLYKHYSFLIIMNSGKLFTHQHFIEKEGERFTLHSS